MALSINADARCGKVLPTAKSCLHCELNRSFNVSIALKVCNCVVGEQTVCSNHFRLARLDYINLDLQEPFIEYTTMKCTQNK
jgi:hypothetical protein